MSQQLFLINVEPENLGGGGLQPPNPSPPHRCLHPWDTCHELKPTQIAYITRCTLCITKDTSLLRTLQHAWSRDVRNSEAPLYTCM